MAPDNVKGGQQSEQDDRMSRENPAQQEKDAGREDANEATPDAGRKGGATGGGTEDGGVAEQANYMGRELNEGRENAADTARKPGDGG